MKNKYTATVLTSLLMLAAFCCVFYILRGKEDSRPLKVGFIYENDESTPYTYNFIQAQVAMKEKYGDEVLVLSRSNVQESEAETPLRELLEEGCSIIFTNSYSRAFRELTLEYPKVQICQVSSEELAPDSYSPNYHTFKGEIYQGRYLSGVVAGMKLKEMIDHGLILPSEAVAGYVAAFPNAEVISGYTAFFLGIRSIVPEATMKVKYTYTWSSFFIERECANELIKKGCLVISQHCDTIAPALACEESDSIPKPYHVGYNQSMLDVAPTTSLVSSRINWEPYVVGAVGAVLKKQRIERRVGGNVHGNDICGGYFRDWVQLLELNNMIAAEGTKEKLKEVLNEMRKGNLSVYYGDYLGVNPFDENDTYDLRKEYIENKNSSAPTFHYVLQDVITIEE